MGYNVDTITDRNKQIALLSDYIQKYQTSKDYVKLPFLWFARRFFANANLLLGIEGFFAHNYYKYLVENLRGHAKKTGAFNLIRNKVSLKDSKWEQLQYSSIKIIDPLSKEELQIIESIYSSISQIKRKPVNEQLIKTSIKKQSVSNLVYRNLDNLFFLAETHGRHWCYPPAFDLKQYYFHLELTKFKKFTEIIDFLDPNNTLLTSSYIFHIKNAPSEFSGFLTIPIQYSEMLINLLQYYNQKGKIIIRELSEIANTRFTTSFSLYRPDLGWKFLTPSIKKQLTTQLIIKNPRKRKEQLKIYFSTRKFNPYWNFRMYENPSKIIDIYCKLFKEFPLNDLKSLSEESPEYYLIKYLYKKRVCQFTLVFYRLLYEFSLDYYWIILPPIPSNQFSRLLNWLPFARIIYTDSKIHIWTYLNPSMYKWISEDLNWIVRPMILLHSPSDLDYNWFDTKKLQWKIPFSL